MNGRFVRLSGQAKLDTVHVKPGGGRSVEGGERDAGTVDARAAQEDVGPDRRAAPQRAGSLHDGEQRAEQPGALRLQRAPAACCLRPGCCRLLRLVPPLASVGILFFCIVRRFGLAKAIVAPAVSDCRCSASTPLRRICVVPRSTRHQRTSCVHLEGRSPAFPFPTGV